MAWDSHRSFKGATVGSPRLAAKDLTNPMDVPSGRPDAEQLTSEGFRCYRRSRGKSRSSSGVGVPCQHIT